MQEERSTIRVFILATLKYPYATRNDCQSGRWEMNVGGGELDLARNTWRDPASGLEIKWGLVTYAAAGSRTNFATPFSNACLSMTFSNIRTYQDQNDSLYSNGCDAAGFSALEITPNKSWQSYNASWIAIGY